tara:strand:+ start:137 stop:361 length:225 start_codon:yes stop_codon:yes gene_type:complete
VGNHIIVSTLSTPAISQTEPSSSVIIAPLEVFSFIQWLPSVFKYISEFLDNIGMQIHFSTKEICLKCTTPNPNQ